MQNTFFIFSEMLVGTFPCKFLQNHWGNPGAIRTFLWEVKSKQKTAFKPKFDGLFALPFSGMPGPLYLGSACRFHEPVLL